MVSRWAVAAAALFGAPCLAQFPPKPRGVTTLPINDGYGSSLSYKETSICESTPGVKGFAGFVNLPAALTGETFDINTFYWYFQARNSPETAPLAIYLAGGPGQSSLFGAASQGGPCRVNSDSNSTTLNPWSWNNEANLLYIDQPVQTGFSYDTLVNGTLEQISGTITPTNFDGHVPKTNATFLVGTFPSQSPTNMTAGSARGANALWHFMQLWTDNFPDYKSVTNKKISLWANSWGGFYGLQTFQFFEQRNEQIQSSQAASGHVLDLGTLGIINGCMDPAIEAIHYPEIATNNTYGFRYYNNTIRDEVVVNVTGCLTLTETCRASAALLDPQYNGNNTMVNELCGLAFIDCYLYVQGAYALSGHSAYDMSQQILAPRPDNYPSGYFNRAWVQEALGVPLNFTPNSNVAETVYAVNVGDAMRTNISSADYLLSRGVNFALVFGDRDYRCNWLGGEAVSLQADWSHASSFRESGYANIVTNSSYNGGYVRQTGGLSFSRVFEAAHEAMYYQPETVYRIFQRSMGGYDVATGKVAVSVNSSYQTHGPSTVRAVNERLPPIPPLDCNLYAIGTTCANDQIAALENGTAVLRDFEVVKPAT